MADDNKGVATETPITPKSKQIRELTDEVVKQRAFADPELFQQAQEWKRQVLLLKQERARLHQRYCSAAMQQ